MVKLALLLAAILCVPVGLAAGIRGLLPGKLGPKLSPPKSIGGTPLPDDASVVVNVNTSRPQPPPPGNNTSSGQPSTEAVPGVGGKHYVNAAGREEDFSSLLDEAWLTAGSSVSHARCMCASTTMPGEYMLSTMAGIQLPGSSSVPLEIK
jgi:hypothetical protein